MAGTTWQNAPAVRFALSAGTYPVQASAEIKKSGASNASSVLPEGYP